MATSTTFIGEEKLEDGRILKYGERDPVTGQRYEETFAAPTPTATTPTATTPLAAPAPVPTTQTNPIQAPPMTSLTSTGQKYLTTRQQANLPVDELSVKELY